MYIYNLILVFGVVLAIAQEIEDYHCELVGDMDDHPVVREQVLWTNITDRCPPGVFALIQTEIDASNMHLQLGAYFSRETVNRPGFAHLFFEAAKEEREQASKLIGYFLKRGFSIENGTESYDMDRLFSFQNEYKLDINEDKSYSGLAALKKALEMKTAVTNSIKELITFCEKEKHETVANNDYHLVNYFTTEFLSAQYNGQSQLAGHISTLSKLMGPNKEIGEFLFDKSLLETTSFSWICIFAICF